MASAYASEVVEQVFAALHESVAGRSLHLPRCSIRPELGALPTRTSVQEPRRWEGYTSASAR
jgi:hypothetical protein